MNDSRADDRPEAPEVEPVAVTRTEPIAAQLSDRLGGPRGVHWRPHWWWTPTRVVLACCAVMFSLAIVQRQPCMATGWDSNSVRYAKMCYSDIPYLYTERGFAEQHWPYAPSARYPAMEYPVGISAVAWVASVLTAADPKGPPEYLRHAASVDALWSMPGMSAEINEYFVITALMLFGLALAASYFLVRANPRRPWDALPFVLSPLLPLAGLVNWDLLAVAATAGALWAWARGRPFLTGVMIGLGTACKLYPLFLLGALLVLALRERSRLQAFLVATFAAALSWLAVNVPFYLEDPARWKVFWSFNETRGADLGSLWLVAQDLHHPVSVGPLNTDSWLLFGAACLAVLTIGLRAPRRPTLAQLGYLVVMAFLIINKVYSPQYVLWLLPLAALARPRWRDQIIWQSCELVYLAAVWWYLGGWLQASATDGGSPLYDTAIIVRVVGELYLAAMIVRDLWRVGDDEQPMPEAQRTLEPALS